MQEPEVIVVEIEELRRAKRRWKMTAICALAALVVVIPVEVLNTWSVMHHIRLERERAVQAERQADMQREESLRLLLHLAQEATRQAQKANRAAEQGLEKQTAPTGEPNK